MTGLTRCEHVEQGVEFNSNGLARIGHEHDYPLKFVTARQGVWTPDARRVLLDPVSTSGQAVVLRAVYDKGGLCPNVILTEVHWSHVVPDCPQGRDRMTRIPRVVAEHHQDSVEIRTHSGWALQQRPEVTVRVECDASDLAAALTALDRAAEDVRAQLRYLERSPVIVGGPDAQDERQAP